MKITLVGNGMRASQRGIIIFLLAAALCAGSAGGLWWWTSHMGQGPAGATNGDMGAVGMNTNSPPDEWYRTNGIPNPR